MRRSRNLGEHYIKIHLLLRRFVRKQWIHEAARDERAFDKGQISGLEAKIRYAEIVNSDAL